MEICSRGLAGRLPPLFRRGETGDVEVVEGLCGGRDVFNFDKLVEILQDRDLQGDGIVDAIFDEVARHSSAEVQQDDMTVLTLGWKTEPALVASI